VEKELIAFEIDRPGDVMKSERGEVVIAVTLMIMAAVFIWAKLEDRRIRQEEGISIQGCPESDYAKAGRDFK
jgi:hypothetical protein